MPKVKNFRDCHSRNKENPEEIKDKLSGFYSNEANIESVRSRAKTHERSFYKNIQVPDVYDAPPSPVSHIQSGHHRTKSETNVAAMYAKMNANGSNHSAESTPSTSRRETVVLNEYSEPNRDKVSD